MLTHQTTKQPHQYSVDRWPCGRNQCMYHTASSSTSTSIKVHVKFSVNVVKYYHPQKSVLDCHIVVRTCTLNKVSERNKDRLYIYINSKVITYDVMIKTNFIVI